MKRFFIALVCVSFCFAASAQEDIATRYSQLTPSPLPYVEGYADRVAGSQPRYGFPYRLWKNAPLDTRLWTDLGLTVREEEDKDEGWPDSALYRTFRPTNGNYRLCAVDIGCGDYGKTMLIAINDLGNYIDAIDVAFAMGAYPNAKVYYPMQWDLNEDMTVVVYQLKPISDKPYIHDKPISFPIRAQRIDKVYRIDSTGRFTFVEEIRYQEESYELDAFANPSRNIRDGNEKRVVK